MITTQQQIVIIRLNATYIPEPQTRIMLSFVVLVAAVSLAGAIVCPPNYCASVTQPDLNCNGNIIHNAGFCGCSDICARVEGETCTYLQILGVPNTAICDTGLVCSLNVVNGVEGHRCVQDIVVKTTSRRVVGVKRAFHCATACQRKSTQCAISMIVYQGQWFAKCDANGNFLPEQCDNTGHCFCVDNLTGHVLDGTKVLGAANCLIEV